MLKVGDKVRYIGECYTGSPLQGSIYTVRKVKLSPYYPDDGDCAVYLTEFQEDDPWWWSRRFSFVEDETPKTVTDDFVLWILMRNDMTSLNPGKAMAQAAHAANQFVWDHHWQRADLSEWQNQTEYGFGTTIVLSASIEEINFIYDNITGDLSVGCVEDPGYPIRDGKTTHNVPVVTCAYIFGRRSVGNKMLSDFALYP